MRNQIRQWLSDERRLPWFPFWVGFISILAGYAFDSGGTFFSNQDVVWAEMQERGNWRVGLDPSFPPFEFLDESGQATGFDPALATKIADQWGLNVKVVPIGFDSLVDALQTGQVDSVVSALPYDPHLTKDILYSVPYFDAGILLVVQEGSELIGSAEMTSFATAEDAPNFLSGKRIGVEWGGMGDMIGRRYQRLLEGKNQAEIELIAFSTPQEAVDALLQDPTLDAILIDNVTLHQLANGKPIVGLGPILESNPYVIASPFNAETLGAEVDIVLEEFLGDGQIEALIETWFSTEQ